MSASYPKSCYHTMNRKEDFIHRICVELTIRTCLQGTCARQSNVVMRSHLCSRLQDNIYEGSELSIEEDELQLGLRSRQNLEAKFWGDA
jgi:hypothetical protein